MSKPEHLIQELENGLILRRSTLDDCEALANFNGRIHADPGEDFTSHGQGCGRDNQSISRRGEGPRGDLLRRHPGQHARGPGDAGAARGFPEAPGVDDGIGRYL